MTIASARRRTGVKKRPARRALSAATENSSTDLLSWTPSFFA